MKQTLFFLCFLKDSNLHGCFTINNKESYTIERWNKIKGKLKVLQIFGVFASFHLKDTNKRQIPPLEY